MRQHVCRRERSRDKQASKLAETDRPPETGATDKKESLNCERNCKKKRKGLGLGLRGASQEKTEGQEGKGEEEPLLQPVTFMRQEQGKDWQGQDGLTLLITCRRLQMQVSERCLIPNATNHTEQCRSHGEREDMLGRWVVV